jgi:ACS family glucarate transporter-like MFS transporter
MQSALVELWIVRAVFGVFAAPMYPTSGRTIAAALAPSLQARANSLVLASVGLGSALTPLIVAPIATRYGWRAALVVPVLISCAALIVWWRLAPDQARTLPFGAVRGSPAALGAAHPSTRWTHPLRRTSFWFLCGSYFLQAYLGYIFVFWFFLYLVRVRHFELLNAAAFTVLPWAATIFAIPAGGVLSDSAVVRWGATWGRRSVPVVALVAAAAFLALGARTPDPYVAVGALTVCTVLVLCTEGPFWATMAQLAPEESGLAGGTMNFAGNVGGLISPALTPWLAERLGWEETLTLTAGLAVVAGALWLGVRITATERSPTADRDRGSAV